MRRRLDDDAVSSLIATLLVVATTVGLSAAAYVTVTQMKAEGSVAPAVSFHEVANACETRIEVAAAQPARWNDMTIEVAGASAYSLTLAGQTSTNASWFGAQLAAPRVVAGGDSVRLALGAAAPGPITTTVRHGPSGGVVATLEPRAPPPDTTPPTFSTTPPSGNVIAAFGVVEGTAQDVCSEIAGSFVALQRVSDGLYLQPGGAFAAPEAWWPASGTSWSVDLAGGACAFGQYRILGYARDAVGNRGPTSATTVDCIPAGTAFDPGFAYEDVNNDLLYTPGVDVALSNASVRDGIHVAAAGRGLVIPPIVGAISVPGDKIEYITSGAGHVTIGVPLTANKEIKLVAGGDVRVANVTLTSSTEKIELLPQRGIYASGATLQAHKEIKAEGPGAIQLNGTTLTSTIEKIVVKTTDDAPIYAFNASVTAWKLIEMNAQGPLLLDDATLVSQDEKLDLFGNRVGAEISARRASVTAKTSLTLDGKGALIVESATLRVTSGSLILKTVDTSYTIHVASAVIDDNNDVAKAEPSGVPIAGSPASGAVNYSG